MQKQIFLWLLAALLIGGCASTKVVTEPDKINQTVMIVPLVENPTRTVANDPAFISPSPDVCIGVVSKFYF